MAVTATPIFPQTITNGLVQIANADAQNLKTIYTAGTNGSKIENILVSSTDSSARDVQFSIVASAVTYIIGTISIPANSGNTNALPVINVLGNSQIPSLSRDSNGNYYLYLSNGSVLKASALTTVTAAKVISIFAQGGDY
jgi:hypothetical protein